MTGGQGFSNKIPCEALCSFLNRRAYNHEIVAFCVKFRGSAASTDRPDSAGNSVNIDFSEEYVSPVNEEYVDRRLSERSVEEPLICRPGVGSKIDRYIYTEQGEIIYTAQGETSGRMFILLAEDEEGQPSGVQVQTLNGSTQFHGLWQRRGLELFM